MSAVSVPVKQVPWRSRRVRHLTPRYVYNRTRQLAYQRAHPREPWLTPAATGLLRSLLRPCDQGAEFGSGRSTVWLAERVAALTSVEHDEAWYRAVSAMLAARGLGNVEYILAPLDQPADHGGDSAYARAALAFRDASIDFALIDGHYRDYAAKFILPKVKPGGLLIIDNANWYLPCRSRSPNSRARALGPATPVWLDVADELAGWRSIWTSSGVWDTAIFVRPGGAGAASARPRASRRPA
jgi:predicted O-methyltransferase YrrM